VVRRYLRLLAMPTDVECLPHLYLSMALLRQTLSGGSKRAIDVFLGVEIEDPSDTPHHVDPCHSETNTCVYVCLCVCLQGTRNTQLCPMSKATCIVLTKRGYCNSKHSSVPF